MDSRVFSQSLVVTTPDDLNPTVCIFLGVGLFSLFCLSPTFTTEVEELLNKRKQPSGV